MNKGDLVNEVAKILSSKKEAKSAVDCILETITKSLEKRESEPVSLIGFGTFKVSERKARKERNPQTGEVIKIKASRVVRFVPGKALKEKI